MSTEPNINCNIFAKDESVNNLEAQRSTSLPKALRCALSIPIKAEERYFMFEEKEEE